MNCKDVPIHLFYECLTNLITGIDNLPPWRFSRKRSEFNQYELSLNIQGFTKPQKHVDDVI